MTPDAARPGVLVMYRQFRRQGQTPIIAMQMVRSAFIGISTIQHGTVDIELPRGLMADAAMQSYVAGRYMNLIQKNIRTDRISPYWNLGFIPQKEPVGMSFLRALEDPPREYPTMLGSNLP